MRLTNGPCFFGTKRTPQSASNMPPYSLEPLLVTLAFSGPSTDSWSAECGPHFLGPQKAGCGSFSSLRSFFSYLSIHLVYFSIFGLPFPKAYPTFLPCWFSQYQIKKLSPKLNPKFATLMYIMYINFEHEGGLWWPSWCTILRAALQKKTALKSDHFWLS